MRSIFLASLVHWTLGAWTTNMGAASFANARANVSVQRFSGQSIDQHLDPGAAARTDVRVVERLAEVGVGIGNVVGNVAAKLISDLASLEV